jgi:RND family efflux transporter MFP subunit
MPDAIETAAFTRPRRLKIAGVVLTGGVVAIIGLGALSRVHVDQSLKAWTRDQVAPTVTLASVAGGGERELALPGTIQAFYTAPIHARTSGYLKRWYADIGDQVKAGQVLAEIDTPDLDQQVLQARAELASAQANQRLASTTAKRWDGLLAQDAVSRQEAEEKAGDLAARVAAVNAARANLNRLLTLESFKRLTAPFDGVVTERNTDIGALISVGGANDTALFTVADLHRLRIYVSIPQAYSALIKPGDAARLTVPEFAGQTFKASVVSDARAIAANGGVKVELQLDNLDGRLRPGAYAQVTFAVAAGPGAARVPATALLFRQQGPVVAVVDARGRARITPIVISRDLGTSVEVGAGLSPGEKVIDNPPDAIANGEAVRVAAIASTAGHAKP